ncbi:MAG TPA: ABC transporter permease [Thermoleophilaceae bacterium]
MRELVRSKAFGFALLLSLALLAANVIAEPSFGKPSNWPQELASFAPLAILAMASTPSILSGGGGLDLSVGPLVIFCNVLLVHKFFPHGLDSGWTAVPLLLLIGAAVGAINGVLVTVLRYQPVIATLCTFFILIGVDLKIGSSPRPTPAHNWTTGLGDKVWFFPGALITLLVPAAIWLLLSRTSYHRQLYAVGGNDATAFSAGVDVTATRIVAYTLGGVFAAIGGIALTALVQSSQAASAGQYTLIALAGVALGGTVIGGGRGGLLGSALGAFAIYLMQTLLSAVNVPATWNNVVYGGMLVAGVIVGARVMMLRPTAREVTA